MSTRTRLISTVERYPVIKRVLKAAELQADRALHRTAATIPAAIRPRPRKLTVAITAHCNLRCKGCHYGHDDFMHGAHLTLETVCDAIADAKVGGMDTVRFYGGEPLLHPALPDMVRFADCLGLRTYVTTNGTHLGMRIERLYGAGLRAATIGFYGIGDAYTSYTGRPGHFERLERSLQTVRERYGTAFALQLNYVVMRGRFDQAALQQAWDFAQRFDMLFHLDLVSPNIPFFRSTEADLLARDDDRQDLERLAIALVALKREQPERILHSLAFLRSVPDWLLKGAAMQVPCDAYSMIWIGADGSVQLCDTAHPLGNILQTRLRDILFGPAHAKAARDAFQLECPNCTCLADSRIQKHRASVRKYQQPLPGESALV